MIAENIFSADQWLNLIASSVLLGLALLSLAKSKRNRWTAVVVSSIAIFNVAFYSVAITTDINEAHRFEYAAISGVRSFVTILALCGVGVRVLRSRL